MTANYVGGIDTNYSVPVNLGFAKTVILGKMPLKLSFQGQYFLTRPDFAGASWGVFFQVTPVIKLPGDLPDIHFEFNTKIMNYA